MTELDGIVWIGGLNDRALQEYQGTRAAQDMRGLPVVRAKRIGSSIRAFVETLPAHWQTIMVLYEGVEWCDTPDVQALKIDLAVHAYTDCGILYFDDPHKERFAGGFILRLAPIRANVQRMPRQIVFEPPLIRHTSDPIGDAVAQVLREARTLH